MFLRNYQPSQKNKELYALIDKLHELKEDIEYHAINKKANRLDKVENNAFEIEKIAKEIQLKVKEMRRK